MASAFASVEKEGVIKKEEGAIKKGPTENHCEDIIIAGGNGLNSVEKFCWTTKQWSHLPATKSRRFLSTSSFVKKDKMFVFGGEYESTIEILELNEEGGEWRGSEARLPEETWGHASTVYEDNLFIFGGKNRKTVFNNIYKLGLVAPTSSQLVPRLPKAIWGHGAQRFGDKVVIVGGTTTGDYRGSVDEVLSYDITRNSCRVLAPLPFAVSFMATVAWGDNVVIIGGLDREGNALNTVVSYNIRNEKSKMLPSMKHKRSYCSAVITGNIIVVMGGFNKKGYLNSVESFSIGNDEWQELPSMNEIRYGATAVVQSLS